MTSAQFDQNPQNFNPSPEETDAVLKDALASAHADSAYDAWIDVLDESISEIAAEEAARAEAAAEARREADRVAGSQLRRVLTKLGFDPGPLETGVYVAPDGVRFQCTPTGTVLLIGSSEKQIDLLTSAQYTSARRNLSIRGAIAAERERLADARDRRAV